MMKYFLNVSAVFALLLTSAGLSAAEAYDPEFVELAPFMSNLAKLTHKLSLSVGYNNPELADFYLYESLELLEEIKETVPEYRGLPIAMLIDRLVTPNYNSLQSAIADADHEKMTNELNKLIDSCNQCHQTTQHGFIKITPRTDFNPFNQDFRP